MDVQTTNQSFPLSSETSTSGPNSGSMLNVTEAVMGSSPSRPDWIVVPSVFAFIFMVGVLGNGILIFIVAVNRNMKTTPNVLLVSLATGDLLLILISSPFTSVYYFYDEWPFGEVMCKLNEFLVTLSLGVSVFTLTALSGERYMVIVFPMQSRRGTNSMTKTVLMAVVIWIVSALLASLDLFMARVVYLGGEKKPIATCIPFPLEDMENNPMTRWYSKFYTIFRFLVYFLIPIIIIATFYAFMALILLRSSNNMPGEAEVKSRTIKQVGGVT